MSSTHYTWNSEINDGGDYYYSPMLLALLSRHFCFSLSGMLTDKLYMFIYYSDIIQMRCKSVSISPKWV